MDEFNIISFKTIKDKRGNLSIVESTKDIPFDIRRIYYLHDVPEGEMRGSHGHRKLQQFFIALSGSFKIKIDNGISKKELLIENNGLGLYLPEGLWRELYDFSEDCICLVLASQLYEPDDYIHVYEDFLEFKKA